MSRYWETLDLAQETIKCIAPFITTTADMTNDGREAVRETTKCLRLQTSVHILFIVYVERSTDAAANEKAREEREAPDVL